MSSNKIVFFGTLGTFSYSVLNQLLDQDANVVAVVISSTGPIQKPIEKLIKIPVLTQPDHATIEWLAIKHGVSLVYLHDLTDSESVDKVSELEPDYIVIACFPQILSSAIFTLPKIACLNIHPSMLPAYRGPTPLFWQLRNDEQRMGISIHVVSQDVDSGDIIQQQEVVINNGMKGQAIDSMLGEISARLVLKCFSLYERDLINPKPQNPAFASYYGFPHKKEFCISTDWTARRAYNFMCGTDQSQLYYTINLAGKDYKLDCATAYSPGGTIENDYIIEEDIITIQLSKGLLKARLHESQVR